jgi:hypothetical protein
MAHNNLTSEQMFAITNLKEMYESNNRLLTSVTQITNSNFNNDNITSLINNLITTNNQIKNNIMNLLNTNSNVNSRQSNTRQPNHRQHNYSNRPNYHSNRQNYLNNPTISNLFYTFFDPIEIFPTQTQIETATRVVRFGDIIGPLNTACPISLENFNEDERVLIIRQCSHIFSNSGLISWFSGSCRCPVCRYDIRSHVSTNTNNITDTYVNVDLSSNVLSSPFDDVERNVTNQFVDLLFSNLLDNYSITDTSGNNLSSNNLSSGNNLSSNNLSSNTYVTDTSGNNLFR